MILFRRSLSVALVIAAAAHVSAGAQPAPARAADYLKWSMNRYAAMASFQSDCKWSASLGGIAAGDAANRTVWYRKPNVYKVVTTHSQTGMSQTAVSDGTHETDYVTGIAAGSQQYSAPPSLADATALGVTHPMFGGSLLYKFFGGASHYSALVNEAKKPVAFGTPVTLDGQKCKTVTFYAQGPTYGNTEIAIGPDGIVHRIQYDSEPLMKMLQSGAARAMIQQLMDSPQLKDQLKKNSGGKSPDTKAIQDAMASVNKNMPKTSATTESYIHISIGKPIDLAVFRAAPPKSQPVMDMGSFGQSKPPVPLGKTAPAITVTELDGVRRTIGDFKGKVVLIDFWATWCSPCRKGLPETQRFYDEYGKRGLAVLAVSDETKATVKPFISQNKFSFPTYLDKGGVTNKAYGITAIPTVAVIDRQGRLSAYLVGLSPRETIVAALKKAGLDTK